MMFFKIVTRSVKITWLLAKFYLEAAIERSSLKIAGPKI